MSAVPPTIHATALVLGTAGVLIRGASGAGKSTLALALLDRWAAAGRSARLVADDRVVLEPAGGRLVARCPGPIAGLLELPGRGILAVDHEPAAVVRLVVDLVADDALERMPEAVDGTVRLEGIALARQAVPRRDTVRAMLLVDAALAALTGTETATGCRDAVQDAS